MKRLNTASQLAFLYALYVIVCLTNDITKIVKKIIFFQLQFCKEVKEMVFSYTLNNKTSNKCAHKQNPTDLGKYFQGVRSACALFFRVDFFVFGVFFFEQQSALH